MGAYYRRGQTKEKTYITWAGMISRCYAKTNSCYKKYGAKGVKVCDRWRGKDGYFNFKNDMGERPEGCSLDRIDPEKGYEKKNCRWASISLQANNKRVKPQYFRGVSKNNISGFDARLQKNGVLHRAHFRTEEEAIKWRIEKEKEILGVVLPIGKGVRI